MGTEGCRAARAPGRMRPPDPTYLVTTTPDSCVLTLNLEQLRKLLGGSQDFCSHLLSPVLTPYTSHNVWETPDHILFLGIERTLALFI